MAFTIDKVYYINQDNRVDRHWTQMFAMEFFGVPYDRIVRFRSRIQNSELPDLHDIIEMMADDGFPEWHVCENPRHANHPTWLASIWSKLSVIREIGEANVNAIMMSDVNYLMGFLNRYDLGDFSAPIKFPYLERACDNLKDMKVLNFGKSYRNWSVASELNVEIKPSHIPGIYHPMVYGRFGAVLFTPEGAVEVLKWYRKFAHLKSDSLFANIFRAMPADEYKGYYFCDPGIVYMPSRSTCEYPFNKFDKVLDNDSSFYKHKEG